MAQIDAEHLAGLLAPGDEKGASHVVKGRALEAALRYVFEKVPGLQCEMERVKNASASEEIDLFFSNVRHEDGLRRFGNELLVEAKNWADPVGAIEISWFATKLRRRNQAVGVLVAAHGITGGLELRSAAVGQLGQALQDGQEVLILERKELEAVSSGERLARLLEKKRDHLVGRQDVFIADPSELQRHGGPIRFGSEAFGALLRGERVKLVEEALALKLRASNELAALEGLRAALGHADQSIGEWNADSAQDPRGLAVRMALMDSAGWCVAWLQLLEHDDPKTIWFNASQGGLDRVKPTVGSRLWSTLIDYYLGELAAPEPESPREVLLFAVVGMLIEEILSLDDYWPEEFE
jgi:hypothetical protein